MNCLDCGAETHQGTYLCARSVKTLEVALGNIAALAPDLDSTRNRGTTTSRSIPGSKPPPGFDLGPDDIETTIGYQIRAALILHVGRTIHTWPNLTWPTDTITGLCGHLQGIRTAIAGQDWSGELIRDVLRLERRVKRAADPEPRIYAGLCLVCRCVYESSPMYAHTGDRWVSCPATDCEAVYDVAECRDAMIADLDTRLCTAAEIATLATYLDLLDDRDKVRKRITQWARRGVITPDGVSLEGEPTYPFGEVTRRILATDSERRAARRTA